MKANDGSDLKLTVRADHSSLERDKQTVLHLIADLEAVGEGIEADRPPMSVVFVLDVSGSMEGEPLAQVKRATRRMIEMLRPDDRAGVVTFASRADVVADVVETSDADKRDIARAIDRIQSHDATNIEAGLRLAHRILPVRRPDERRAIILLSDGMPNAGATTADGLRTIAQVLRSNAVTSTLGFGHAHSEPVLSALAEGGGGTYHYIRDPALSQLHFAAALSAQGDIVAEAIELAVVPHADIEVLGVIGTDRTRYKRGTFLIDVADMLARSTHRVAVRVRTTTPKECGPMRLADVTLRFRRAGSQNVHTVEASVTVPVTRDGSMVALMPLRAVLVLRAEEERKKARDLADKGRYAEAASMLRMAASMIEQMPSFASSDGSELAEAWDQLRDDADLYDQRPDAGSYAEFRRGQRLGTGGDFSAKAKMPVKMSSRALYDDAAGPLPNAALVDLRTAERFLLDNPVNIIGRSRTCDIYVPSSKVSRQSAAVVAEHGAFWVEDLGSANGVWMDGTKISKQRLDHGKVIIIGDIELRYEVTPDPKDHPATNGS